MHPGVIFVFPIMYLKKTELGEVIPPARWQGNSLLQKACRREEEEEAPDVARTS